MSEHTSHNKLYRDLENKRIAGVCAGIADYFSIDTTIVRILCVIAGISFTFVTIVAYICGMIFMEPKPKNLYSDSEDEAYWRRYRKSPRDTLAEVKNRFRKLDRRLRKLETCVTSKKFKLNREFSKIDDAKNTP